MSFFHFIFVQKGFGRRGVMMAEARLLQLHPIDGRDEIEDFWLRNRDLVLQVRNERMTCQKSDFFYIKNR